MKNLIAVVVLTSFAFGCGSMSEPTVDGAPVEDGGQDAVIVDGSPDTVIVPTDAVQPDVAVVDVAVDAGRPVDVQAPPADVTPETDAGESHPDVVMPPVDAGCGSCDDGNPCTLDGCVSGVCAHTMAPNGTACGGTNECFAGSCSPCGTSGTRCCATGAACSAGTQCNGAFCAACGGNGQACCGSTTCSAGLACGASHLCSHCGGRGEPCCGGTMCNAPAIDGSGVTCVSGTCQCGGTGQPCCAGDTCGPTGGSCHLTGSPAICF